MICIAAALSWLTSPAGIAVQATAALVCQLVGVVLVVKEIRENRSRLIALAGRFDEIDRQHVEAAAPHVELLDKLPDVPHEQFGDVFAAPFMITSLEQQKLADKLSGLAALQRDLAQRGQSAFGVVLLLLGIVFSFTATISGL